MKQRTKKRLGGWLLMAAVVLAISVAVAWGVPFPSFTTTSRTAQAAPSAAPASQPEKTELDPQVELVKRAADLTKRETDLKDQQAKVSAMASDLASQEAKQDSLGKAAAMYGAMPPFKAGPLMQALDPDLAVQVLRVLEADQAAAILAYMDPARAAQLISRVAQPTPSLFAAVPANHP